MKTLKIHGVPGGGKTRTLLELFGEELKTIKPSRIGFLTFTRAARLEALSRATLSEEELPYVKTIHATCYKVLNLHQDQLVLKKQLREFGKSLGVQLTGYIPDMFGLESITEAWRQPTKADRLLQLNHLGRHRMLKLRETLRDAPQELDYKYAKWFTQAYRDWKTAKGLLDYTDLLVDYLEHGEPLDLDVLFIDESQDLSALQWAVARKMGANCQRKYMCGDPDQSIFSWAGASASLFDLEPADDVRFLPHSYRLSRAVHELGQKIVHRVKVRVKKEYTCRDSPGEYRPIGRLDPEHVSGESLVLFRNYHRGVALALQLEELAVPFLGSNSVLSNQDIKLTLSAHQKIQQHQPVTLAEARALSGFALPAMLQDDLQIHLKASTGELSATAIFKTEMLEKPWHHMTPKLNKLGYLQRVVATHGFEKALKPVVNLISIHQSKGREAQTVVLDLELARRTYEAYMGPGADDEERVFYVAVTRAKERLLTLMPQDPMSYRL